MSFFYWFLPFLCVAVAAAMLSAHLSKKAIEAKFGRSAKETINSLEQERLGKSALMGQLDTLKERLQIKDEESAKAREQLEAMNSLSQENLSLKQEIATNLATIQVMREREVEYKQFDEKVSLAVERTSLQFDEIYKRLEETTTELIQTKARCDSLVMENNRLREENEALQEDRKILKQFNTASLVLRSGKNAALNGAVRSDRASLNQATS